MARRGTVSVTLREDLSRPINAGENDQNLTNLRDGVLASSEAADPSFPHSVVADNQTINTDLTPGDYLPGMFSEIKFAQTLDLPGGLTGRVFLTTFCSEPGDADVFVSQVAYVPGAFPFTRRGLVSTNIWGAWAQVGNAADLLAHESATDPHPQYLTRAEFPAGLILANGSDTAPTGSLLCDGASYPTADFPQLFARIGYKWGGSGGVFKVPDMRGRTLVGAGAGDGLTARTLAQVGGSESVVLDITQIPAHTHGYVRDRAVAPDGTVSHENSDNAAGTEQTGSEGGGQPHPNMPPFAVATWVITTGTGSSSGAGGSATAPAIVSFTPSSGPVGTAVSISGANFSAAVDVKFNGISSGFTIISPTQINTTVPGGATSGQISVISSFGTALSASPFTVSAANAPIITSFSPIGGPSGTIVDIVGSKFTGASAVKINGVAMTAYTVNSDTSITATIPAGTSSGPITVTTTFGIGTSSTSFIFGAAPTITSFSPSHAHVGDAVVILGTGFDASKGPNVLFGTTPAPFIVNSPTQITATVPNAAVTASIHVNQATGNATSATAFTVDAGGAGDPTITSFTPTTAPIGQRVTVTGTGFDGTSLIYFTNVDDPSGFSVGLSQVLTGSTVLSAIIPAGADNGVIKITKTAQNPALSTQTLTITPTSLAPTITSFSPATGNVGNPVSIFGTNFDSATSVRFNGTSAIFTIVNAGQINATVPAGATDGTIAVTNPSGTATSASSFDVTAPPANPPTITGFSPLSGPAGTVVTIMGTNFDSSAVVRFNGVTASRTVNSATSITATVPTGASSGNISIQQTAGTATSSQTFTVSAGGTEVSLNITANTVDYNVASHAGNPAGVVSVTLTIGAGVVVSGNVTNSINFTGFAAGSTFKLINNGTIRGHGGNGGAGNTNSASDHHGHAGQDAGHAVFCQGSITVDNLGTIEGGGGGGAGNDGDGTNNGAGGGGGEGQAGGSGGNAGNGPGGAGATAGTAGTLSAIGVGGSDGLGAGDAGNGGAYGMPGDPNATGTVNGGRAGSAIKLLAGSVTFITVGTIVGPSGL